MGRGKDLLSKFAQEERNFRQKEFLAPFTPKSRTAIVKMNGVNYDFRIVGHKSFGSGFGVFKPIDHSCAKFVKVAEYEQIRPYLDILPKVHMILCYETDDGWVSYPMNVESSKATLGLDREIIVKNVTDCERFDVVTARYDGAHFWFDEMFAGADVVKSEDMRNCFDPSTTVKKMRDALGAIKGLTPEDHKAFDVMLASWTLFKQVTTEDRLKHFIEPGGGKLKKYVLRGDHVEILWNSESGASYVSVVQKDTLDVVSAGICLSGEDNKFHLKDLPFIVVQGEQRDAIYRTGNARAFNMDDD